MNIEQFHENQRVLHVNTEANRAYYIPEKNGVKSIISLNGEWDFEYYRSIYEVGDDFYNHKLHHTIPVPSCWQNHGFDTHMYTNVRYPFPFDPPYVPDENPCGAYVRTFEWNEEGQRAFLNFEGVDSCFYLWINGIFAGYSQVSHSTSEFEITKYLTDGENSIAVLVMKWCDGSYLEDQDKLRMSGIFRDVYILKRPKEFVRDYFIRTAIEGDSAHISIDVEVSGNPGISYELYDCGNKLIEKKDVPEFFIKNPCKWTAETPYLYTVKIKTDDEEITDKVGIREVKVDNGVITLNGAPIKMKGVNRHDSDPVTGYTISREQAKKDLRLMKQHNINAVRTSHYPNAPWFLGLCDEYGFYVIAEADIEIHGTSAIYGGSQANTFGLLANDPKWSEAILDRVQRSVIRDKNHASVIIWSLGNEGGYGVCFEEAGKWVKNYDPSRLTHYESSLWQMPGHKNDTSMLDICSTMYADYEWIDNYFKAPGNHVWKNREENVCGGSHHEAGYWVDLDTVELPDDEKRELSRVKPYIQCEFAHAMGNSPGGIKEYIDQLYKYDGFSGAFVWEWCDHAVYMGEENGKAKYYYGGDFGEYPNDGNFCMDGLVYPDRTPHTGLLEYKNAISPVYIGEYDADTNSVTLENRMDFLRLSEYAIVEISCTKDNKSVEITDFELLPHERKRVAIPFSSENELLVMINIRQKFNTQFIKAGDVLGFRQIVINEKNNILPVKNLYGEVYMEETLDSVYIQGEDFSYIFNKRKGLFESLKKSDSQIIKKPMEWNIWRAPTDNDRNIRTKWELAGYNRIMTKVYRCTVIKDTGRISIKCCVGITAVSQRKLADMDVVWDVYSDGTVDVSADVIKGKDLPPFPRFGLRLFLSDDHDQVEYFGYGPNESYEDKNLASYFGVFSCDIRDMHEDYIKPQENGSHMRCRYVSVDGITVTADKPFSFNMSKYTQEELTEKKHNFELNESGYTVLCIDYKQHGIGTNSCGPEPLKQYSFCEEKFGFKFRIKV